MPRIGWMHPQVVHFVIASLFVGLPIYWLSFLKRPRFLRPMATVLLVIGAGASVFAVRSGLDAHGPAERIPGARPSVQHHEELGILTRNIFLGLLAVEVLALAVAWRAGAAGESTLSIEAGETNAAGASTKRFAATAMSGVVAIGWAVGAFQLYETAEHGGEIVYEHAGGVGFRTGDDEDVSRLLLAGLFGQARVDRDAGRHEAAARLVDEMVARYPDDVEVQLIGVESLLVDREDGRAALDRLAMIHVPDDPRMQLRKQTSEFDAYMLLEMPDSARVAIEGVPQRYAESPMVKQRREQLGG